MQVKNPTKAAIPSTINLAEFAHAMKQLNLANIPQENRKSAVFDHFITIMADNVTSPAQKYEILMSQHLRRKTARGAR